MGSAAPRYHLDLDLDLDLIHVSDDSNGHLLGFFLSSNLRFAQAVYSKLD